MRRFFGYFLTPWNIIAVLLALGALAIRYEQTRPTALAIDPALLDNGERPKSELPLRLYFATADGRNYSVETRSAGLNRDDLETRAAIAVRVWLEGPLASGSLRLVPPDADTPTVYARKDSVFLDLPASWTGYQLGLSGETLLYCGLASTLLDLQGVTNVQYLLNGKPAATIGGHVETLQPFTKDTCPKR
jgi:Sporulation and spore germination